MKTVFLGGTAGDSTWRDELISLLDINKVDAFNPVVPDWNEEAQKKEDKARVESDYVLYVLTPETPGTYSIAEVVDDSNKRPRKTLFAAINYGGIEFEGHQIKAFTKIGKMITDNGAKSFTSIQEIADFLNTDENFTNPHSNLNRN